ncbi:peptide/nickel transport system substrate-binding protein [Amycolatopsis xylanica]|uniref:Peptide/nickel transport system substrate-binding protein n=1 Tax=Amycolatopsis xylanica TaxID=589385 RepID=A0A1H3JU75_9PSEU|nr:ABC transporter substrate-binding protein [Amycolatopsis xylanica]SDY43431.1 peptide/nickel transport system substrate-binding protein [Amycolatopsis xylanica]
MDRRTFLRSVTAAAALTGTGGLLAACNANPAAPAPNSADVAKGGTLYILSDLSVQQLDPAKSQNLAITVLGLVHRRLTSWKIEEGKPATVVPDLATDTGRPSDGGKTWTFTLKDNVKYADGTPIVAADIKYGIERSFAAAFTGGLAYHKKLLAGADAYKGPFEGSELASIEVPDPKTIVFRLTQPYGDWTWIASTPPFAPVPKGKGTDASYTEKPIASGPYQVTSYAKGVEVKLSRNTFWDKGTDEARAGLPDDIVIQLGQQTDIISQRLIADAGNDKFAFSVPFVAPAQLAQIQGNQPAKQRLVTSKSGALAYVTLNTRRPALADPKVRQAFQYAVDKASYQIASAGSAELAGGIATTLITEGIAGREVYDLYPAPPGGDVEKAKQLLREAGHADGIGPLDFVVYNSNNYQKKGEAVQAALLRAGIKTELRVVDSEAWEALVTGNEGTYDLTVSSWQPDFPSATGNIQPLFDTKEIGNGGYNTARYSNPEVDKLITQAQSTVDPVEAGKIWAKADRLIMQDSPVVPLIYTRNSFLHGSKIGNFVIGGFPAYPNFLQVGLTK